MSLICVQHTGLSLIFRHAKWSDYFVFCQYLQNEASEANFDSKSPPRPSVSKKLDHEEKNFFFKFEKILFFCCVAINLIYYVDFKINLNSVLQSVSYRFHTDMNSVSISVQIWYIPISDSVSAPNRFGIDIPN